MTALGIDIGGSSIKAVCIQSGGAVRTAISQRFKHPDRAELTSAIKECLVALGVNQPKRVGLCLPGRMNPDRSAIEIAVNLPALKDWSFDDLLTTVFGHSITQYRVVSDADAAAHDFATDHPIPGRTAALSLGTGVGLCVLDATEPVSIGTAGAGHIGHVGDMDIGRFGSSDRLTNAGTRNTPESYFGAAALQRWSTGSGLNLSTLTQTDPPIKALVQTLRIIHAIYLPSRIVLLGGVALAFKPHANMIAKLVNHQLTPLADPNWTLDFATTPHHAAQGAAKLAAQVS